MRFPKGAITLFEGECRSMPRHPLGRNLGADVEVLRFHDGVFGLGALV
jgi:hypothetical protein